MGEKTKGEYQRIIRNIKEERIFMAGGLAAGLAVAFNAPISGTLMALEGSTSFLTVPVVVRIFGCAMFATFFNDVGHVNWSSDRIKSNNLIVISEEAVAPTYAYMIWEVLIFLIMGILGGILGASATYLNHRYSKWRHHVIEKKVFPFGGN
jgi:H+/Cl- antiporter ClcA